MTHNPPALETARAGFAIPRAKGTVMGNRCYIELQCREVDECTFEERGFVRHDWGEEPEGVARMIDEAGCACDFPENIPFVGQHGSGSDYDEGCFASDGDKYVETGASFGGDLFVTVDAEGTPNPDNLQHVREFVEVAKRARDILGIS